MKDTSIRELMTQGAERILQEGHDQFVQKHIERERQKREQKKRDAEASAEIIYPNALRIPDENIENATYSGTAHHG